MRRVLRTYVFGVLAFSLFFSCKKEEIPTQIKSSIYNTKEMVALSFSASKDSAFETKAIIGADGFPEGSQFGIAILKDGSPVLEGYSNIKATLGSGSLSLSMSGSDVEALYIPRSEAVDIYAYYPYNESVSDLTAIPFTSGEDDLMWSHISLSSSQTNPSDRNPVPVDFTFKHALACIQVNLSNPLDEPVTLEAVSLVSPSESLFTGGSFNLLTQVVTPSGASSRLGLSPNATIASGGSSTFSFLMPSVAYSEGMKLEFVLSGELGTKHFDIPSTIKNGSTGASETLSSFEAGKRYSFNISFNDDGGEVVIENVRDTDLPISNPTWGTAIDAEEKSLVQRGARVGDTLRVYIQVTASDWSITLKSRRQTKYILSTQNKANQPQIAASGYGYIDIPITDDNVDEFLSMSSYGGSEMTLFYAVDGTKGIIIDKICLIQSVRVKESTVWEGELRLGWSKLLTERREYTQGDVGSKVADLKVAGFGVGKELRLYVEKKNGYQDGELIVDGNVDDHFRIMFKSRGWGNTTHVNKEVYRIILGTYMINPYPGSYLNLRIKNKKGQIRTDVGFKFDDIITEGKDQYLCLDIDQTIYDELAFSGATNMAQANECALRMVGYTRTYIIKKITVYDPNM